MLEGGVKELKLPLNRHWSWRPAALALAAATAPVATLGQDANLPPAYPPPAYAPPAYAPPPYAPPSYSVASPTTAYQPPRSGAAGNGYAAGTYVAGPSPLNGARPEIAAGEYSVPAVINGPAAALQAIMAADRTGDAATIRRAMAYDGDPAAQALGLWALADSAPQALSFQEAERARRELQGWPRPERREMAAERLLPESGLPAAQVVAWFAGQSPRTLQGAMALASAVAASGDAAGAAAVIRPAWRALEGDLASQQAVLTRFGVVLAPSDHIAREDRLLYGPQGPAAQDMLRLLPPDQQSLALARMAVRRGDPSAEAMVAALPIAAQSSPGLAYERVLSLVNHGQEAAALPLVGYLAVDMPEGAGERLWRHGHLVAEAETIGSWSLAYAAAAHSGLVTGPEAADANFRAGWIALTKLHDPRRAEEAFVRVQAAGGSPLTQSRGLYWRGRALEAMGDPVGARLAYGEAARFQTAFYGQLAAERIGETNLDLGRDPAITASDRERFQAHMAVRAARLLAGYGLRDPFRVFVTALSESLTTPADEAMLVDLAQGLDGQALAMKVVRNAAKHGVILPDRGYPIRSTPLGYGLPEPAFMLAIVRQESSFDPSARSGAGARGMMQLMPATAATVARRAGLGGGDLDDPDYNMRVGGAYLGQLVEQFSGSYVMAAAAYNAGPGRPSQWAAVCGDPRSAATDPLDFVECIPFYETRDYVMRVLEAVEVYRARLRGGEGRITLAADLRRGGYGASGAAAGR